MTPSGSTAARSMPRASAQVEREQIRALLLAEQPDLARRIHFGPSGALVIPLSTGRSIEIGRMRRGGTARWVVAAPEADRARLWEPTTLRSVARTALAALEAEDERP